ncbi:MAG: L-glutamate gamma-semialdehyde dehydrogenase [Bacteroidales bacterium]|nr:L-glutamate gamma-semialdehyde dehydrogenase [Bacteroidales bacterium]
MNNALYRLIEPRNEPVKYYEKESHDFVQIMETFNAWRQRKLEIPLIIGGKRIYTGKTKQLINPNNHQEILAVYHQAGEKEINMAIDAARQAKEEWMTLSWVERVSIYLKIAELLSKKYRYDINALTMLGQGKNIMQAEIDAACESIDYLRFNSYFLSQLYEKQPFSDYSALNRMEYRPLEGFIFAISPFNFTAIALNLALAPALMGNTIVWKPASTAVLSNYFLMQIYEEAGLPPGVVNFIPGNGSTIGDIVLSHPDLGGVHFTGSTTTFNQIWKTVANYLEDYKSYPRLVGETGGKDFVVVHPSADVDTVVTALIRGAFEYQGQKCSAASRAYIPESLWGRIRHQMLQVLSEIKIGDVSDPNNFVNAVIDQQAFDRIMRYIDYAKSSTNAQIIWGGGGDSSVGYYIEPTVIQVFDPYFKTMQEEIFGPVLSIYVYKDSEWSDMLQLVDRTSPYGLTGSIISQDRKAWIEACRVLRFAAGNIYYNDKPTGAVVGMQPFGGARKSGTNDKAGGYLNLLRWTSPRTIKENFLPPTNYKYPYLD